MNSFKWTVSPVPARQQIAGVWSAAKGILYPQKKPHPWDSWEWLFVAVTCDVLLFKRILVPEFYLWDKTNPRRQQSPVSSTGPCVVWTLQKTDATLVSACSFSIPAMYFFFISRLSWIPWSCVNSVRPHPNAVGLRWQQNYAETSATHFLCFYHPLDGSSLRRRLRKVVSVGVSLTLPRCPYTAWWSWNRTSRRAQSCWTWRPPRCLRLLVSGFPNGLKHFKEPEDDSVLTVNGSL